MQDKGTLREVAVKKYHDEIDERSNIAKDLVGSGWLVVGDWWLVVGDG